MLLFVLSGVGIHRSNFLKLGVKICTYNDHCSAPSSRALLVGLAPPTLLGLRSRHCHGINYTHHAFCPYSFPQHTPSQIVPRHQGIRIQRDDSPRECGLGNGRGPKPTRPPRTWEARGYHYMSYSQPRLSWRFLRTTNLKLVPPTSILRFHARTPAPQWCARSGGTVV